jgi:hypothetical protein
MTSTAPFCPYCKKFFVYERVLDIQERLQWKCDSCLIRIGFLTGGRWKRGWSVWAEKNKTIDYDFNHEELESIEECIRILKLRSFS